MLRLFAGFFYRTVGPGTDWAEFAGAFGDIADRVHIATGNPAITARLQETLVDYPFHVATFLDVDGLRPRLGAAVMHGGHGITLACVALAGAQPGHRRRLRDTPPARRIGHEP